MISDKERKRLSSRTVWGTAVIYFIIWKIQWFGQDDDDLGKVWLKVRKGRGRKVGIASASTLTIVFHTYCTLQTWVKGAVSE